jgi:hypothetical protein
VSQRDGQGHEFWRVAAGETDHHALITGTDSLNRVLAHLALLGLEGLVHAQGNICALLLDRHQHATRLTVKAELGPRVANVHDYVAHQRIQVHVDIGSDLAHDQHQAGCDGTLTRHAGIGIVGYDRIEYGIRNQVAHFVRVALCDRLGGEEELGRGHESVAHRILLLLGIVSCVCLVN